MNWNNPIFRKQLVISLALLALVLLLLFFILEYAENRAGFIIEKGWMDAIAAPANYSVLIFTATYSAAAFGVFLCFRKPETALLLIRTYLLLQLMRALVLFVVPLDPPEGIIPLNDPFLQSTFYNGRPNLKDLFFSGHIATTLIFFCILPQRWAKGIIITLTLLAATCIVLQRVHYISDVIAAPFFTWIAFRLAKRWSVPVSG